MIVKNRDEKKFKIDLDGRLVQMNRCLYKLQSLTIYNGTIQILRAFISILPLLDKLIPPPSPYLIQCWFLSIRRQFFVGSILNRGRGRWAFEIVSCCSRCLIVFGKDCRFDLLIFWKTQAFLIYKPEENTN